jgi:hypothetical protein
LIENNGGAIMPSEPKEETHVVSVPSQNDIIKVLRENSFSKPTQITFIYHEFALDMAKALFTKENYLNDNNIVFYLGLLFNLLKIIENNLKNKQTQSRIHELIEAFDNRIENEDYSPLMIVWNFFLSPRYHRQGKQTKIKEGSCSRIAN